MKFMDTMKKEEDMLDLYTHAITKAHGAHHPEVFEVRDIYKQMEEKMKHDIWDMSEEFHKLREITHNYAIPSDVCETFKKTYTILKDLDQKYQAEV